jgi:hypothetical protein
MEFKSKVVSVGAQVREMQMARSKLVVGALSTAMTAALLTGYAAAQTPELHMPMGGDAKTMTDEEKQQQDEREREYKDAVKKIPDQKANTDPWGNVRSGTPSKGTQKKTGSNTTGSSSK